MFISAFDRGLQIITPSDKPFIITLPPDVTISYVQALAPIPSNPVLLMLPKSYNPSLDTVFPASFSCVLDMPSDIQEVLEALHHLSAVYRRTQLQPVVWYDDITQSVNNDSYIHLRS